MWWTYVCGISDVHVIRYFWCAWPTLWKTKMKENSENYWRCKSYFLKWINNKLRPCQQRRKINCNILQNGQRSIALESFTKANKTKFILRLTFLLGWNSSRELDPKSSKYFRFLRMYYTHFQNYEKIRK